MVNIHAHKKDLTKITTIVKTMLDVDVAIFDLNSRLLAATDEYYKQKGHRVHEPSIQEVLTNGNVVVNKPGHMAACTGCRFLGNCPAKIELLKRFGTGSGPMGVMALTSFTQEGHDKITRETNLYSEALTLFSSWIPDLVSGRDKVRALSETEEILTTLMDMSEHAMMTIDARGMVTRVNEGALNLFASCDLCTRSAFHILPETMVNKILNSHAVKDAKIRLNKKETFLSARPIHIHDTFTGALLTLSPKYTNKKQRQPANSSKVPEIGFSSILGNSPAIAEIKQTAAKIANSASTILITGDTGTGKGLLARAIHNTSERRTEPFVPVNCASIPDTLFESELFGYEEGAFTGARKGGKPGRFEMAHQGTLFLDEIGEMPLHLQAKLLNVLQDNAFQRVGGTEFIPVDVRVIAATNQDIDTLVKEKKFRADLYYRLNVIPIDLPSLKKRKADIPILCEAFIDIANTRAGKSVKKISKKTMELFDAHHWPGNVRELMNIIEYSVNMTNTSTITPDALPQRFLDSVIKDSDTAQNQAVENSNKAPGNIRQKAAMAEAKAILEGLEKYGHDVSGKQKTAQRLGISLRTLYRKLGALDSADPTTLKKDRNPYFL